MKIFLVGASGSIGFFLFKFLKKKKIKVIGTYKKNKKPNLINFSLGKKKSENNLLKKIEKGDLVFFLSSYTEVSWVRKNKKESTRVNYLLTKNFLNKLISKDIRFFYFSSAEVFDGKKGFYDEKSQTNPVNIYGKLKFQIENYLKKTKYKNYYIVRTGRNIDMTDNYRCMIKDSYLTLLKPNAKMAEDNLFTITHQRDFSKAILKIIKKKDLPKILHLCSSQTISRIKFAELIMKFSINSKYMSYKKCKFKEIDYGEKRAAKNNLNAYLTSKILNIQYTKAEKIIKEKVKILDQKLKPMILNEI